jgi:hypothetical protein
LEFEKAEWDKKRKIEKKLKSKKERKENEK